MSVIKIENLTFSYSSACDNIFDNVSFQLDTDWKLGFTGRNGKGKLCRVAFFLTYILNRRCFNLQNVFISLYA